MTVTKTYCDHCGAELDKMKDYDDICIDFGVRPYLSIDLCCQCMDELYRNVVIFCNQDAE